MPLLDHFHPPLRPARQWHSFHSAWATFLAADFNHRLPPGFFAEANARFNIEIDVAAFEAGGAGTEFAGSWMPPAPVQTVPLALVTDVVEVLVYGGRDGPALAGAVELVSPSNKDRPESRDAFTSKCAAFVQQGVGLIVVDIVTEWSANLHDELMARVAPATPPWGATLYATAYRPAGQNGATHMDVWREELALGRPLPTLPLWLREGPCLPADLGATYERTCREYRITTNGA